MDLDLECLHRIRRGDGGGLDDLMKRHGDALYRFVLKSTSHPEDAADLVQETFVRVYRHASAYRQSGSVKTWIFSIALNLCRDRARRAARRRWLSFDSGGRQGKDGRISEVALADPSAGPAERAEERETERIVMGAIRDLPEKLQTPFVLCVLEGHAQAEVAEMLGTSMKTVELRIYRARRQLRATLLPWAREAGLF